MSLYDTLRNKLTPDLLTQVTDALGDDFDYDQVPRSRLNKVIRQRNALREQIEGSTQPIGTTGSVDDDDDDDVTVTKTTTKRKGQPLDEAALRAQWEQEQNTRENRMRVEFAALNYLRDAGAIDPDLVMSLLKLDDYKLENNVLVGIEEPVNALKSTKGYLFGTTGTTGRQTAESGTGKKEGSEGNDGGTDTTKEEFLKLSYQEQMDFKTKHPEQFKKFLGM